MASEFEWNWLGYLWVFLVGFPVTLATVTAYAEGRESAGRFTSSGTGFGAYLLAMLAMFGALVLGVVTIFVWDWKTAGWLTAGAVAWGVLAMLLRDFVERLFRKGVPDKLKAYLKRLGGPRVEMAAPVATEVINGFESAVRGMHAEELEDPLRAYVSGQEDDRRAAMRDRLAHDKAFHVSMTRALAEMVILFSRAGVIDDDAEFSIINGHLLSVARGDSPEMRALRLHYLNERGSLSTTLTDSGVERKRFEKRLADFSTAYTAQQAV